MQGEERNPELVVKTTQPTFGSHLPQLKHAYSGCHKKKKIQRCRITVENIIFPVRENVGEVTAYFLLKVLLKMASIILWRQRLSMQET